MFSPTLRERDLFLVHICLKVTLQEKLAQGQVGWAPGNFEVWAFFWGKLNYFDCKFLFILEYDYKLLYAINCNTINWNEARSSMFPVKPEHCLYGLRSYSWSSSVVSSWSSWKNSLVPNRTVWWSCEASALTADLSICEFFLWGHLEANMYKEKDSHS